MRFASWMALAFVSIILLAVGFQNCSVVKFTAPQDESTTAQGTSTPPPSSEPLPPNPDPPNVSCPTGQTYDGFKCVTPISGCQQYAHVQPDSKGLLSIPARTANQVCYYIRLFHERKSGVNLSGDDFLPVRTDIVAADHDQGTRVAGGGYHFTKTRHPTILEEKILDVLINGERDVILSADSTLEKELFVDNVIWLEFTAANVTQLWLRGTLDIFPRASVNGPFQPILFGDRQVSYTSPEFAGAADGGIEVVTPAVLSAFFPVQQKVRFRANALDCGGGKAMSDGFLIFR